MFTVAWFQMVEFTPVIKFKINGEEGRMRRSVLRYAFTPSMQDIIRRISQ
jgi:hypothetical protein